PPYRLALAAPLVAFDGPHLQTFGVGVDGADDAAGARRHRADVKVVSGGEAETDQLAFEENRHAESNVGTVRGAVIRRVVDEHVAFLEAVAALFEQSEDALHV